MILQVCFLGLFFVWCSASEQCNYFYPTLDTLILNCTDRQLTEIPNNVWPDKHEQHLKKISSSFRGNFFDKLERLPKVVGVDSVHISLSHCGIRNISNGVFDEIANLTFLDLSHNLLTGITIHEDVLVGKFKKGEYEPLTKLRILNLSYNNIHALRKKSFEHVPNLKHLYLSHNPLKVLGITTVAAISSTPHLQILDLSATNLYHISDEAFAVFKELAVLFLADNYLRTVPESLVYASDSLRLLDFSGNAAEELNDESFLGLKKLTHLNISGMYNLKTIKSGTFQWLKSLHALYISHNPLLSYIDKDAFGELKLKWPISELYINNNSLTQVSIQLAVWENLVQLDLSNNPWRCDCQLFHTMKKIKAKYRERNQNFPVCHEPTYLSGISLYAMPKNICNKPPMNGTLNGLFDAFFKDEQKRTRQTARRQKVVVALMMIAFLVLGLSVIAFILKLYLTSKERRMKDKFNPVKYMHANTSS